MNNQAEAIAGIFIVVRSGSYLLQQQQGVQQPAFN
jgi:hypothetical protein